MFEKLLSSIGVGAAKVDTIVSNPEVERGGLLKGKVMIYGGNAEQEISKIYLELVTSYYYDAGSTGGYKYHTILEHDIHTHFFINPHEKKEIPFEFIIPYDSPISYNSQRVDLNTGLDIALAVDPRDYDPLVILPDPATRKLLNAIGQLGLQHKASSGNCHYQSSWTIPYRQEFNFKPITVSKGKIDELDICVVANSSGIDVVLEVDKRAGGIFGIFAEALDLDEKFVKFSIKHNQDFSVGDLEHYILKGL
jgi:sporulation-control protein